MPHINSIETFLQTCPTLEPEREKFSITFDVFFKTNPDLAIFARPCLTDTFLQFILDCSVLPPIISAVQQLGHQVLSKLFSLTRNYCFVMHKTRIGLLKAKVTSFFFFSSCPSFSRNILNILIL